MSITIRKPVTATQRHTRLVVNSNLWRGTALKRHTYGMCNSSARNNTGHITVRHHGGGAKRSARILNFYNIQMLPTFVLRIEYDPVRSAYIALVCQQRNMHTILCYILASRGIYAGTYIDTGNVNAMHAGIALHLSKAPLGAMVHSITKEHTAGIQYVRSSGTFGQVISRQIATVLVKLPSGEKRLFSSAACATLGSVSNADAKDAKLGKAGRSRWLNVRPSVRGIAMNPIDHPHGGGQGRTGTGRHPVSPWGFLAKGKRTRSVRKNTSAILKFRYQK
jgi:large subunit ribosomal protein L2